MTGLFANVSPVGGGRSLAGRGPGRPRLFALTLIGCQTMAFVPLAAAAAEPEPSKPAVPTKSAAAAKPEAGAAEGARFTAGDDQSIYIIQNRAYAKAGSFEITPVFFTSLNPKFVGYLGSGVSLAYHLRENLAIELMSSLYTRGYWSSLVIDVFQNESLTPENVDLKMLDYFAALSLQYSAIYGKFELYGILVDYDFYVTAGFGYGRALEPCNTRATADTTDTSGARCKKVTENDQGNGKGLRRPALAADANKFTGNLGGGIRLFFHDMVGLRLEVRDIVFADRAVDGDLATGAVTTDIRNALMLFMGVSVML